jgi:NAD(P)-dependent dehydrogenase (short-subunit alcohol dehydrogenase family)
VIERWGRLDVLVNNVGAGAASNRLLLVRFQLAFQRPNRRREWLTLLQSLACDGASFS